MTLVKILKVGITLIFQNPYSVDKYILIFPHVYFGLLGEGAFKEGVVCYLFSYGNSVPLISHSYFCGHSSHACWEDRAGRRQSCP